MQDQVVMFRGTVYESGYGLIARKVMRDKKLHPTAKAMYAYLCSFAGTNGDNTPSAFPSVDLMKGELGIKTQDTFYKYQKQLVQSGYITIEKGKREKGKFQNNIYYIEPVPEPKTAEKKNEDDGNKESKPKKPQSKKSTTEKSTTKKSTTNTNNFNTNNFNTSVSKYVNSNPTEVYQAYKEFFKASTYSKNEIQKICELYDMNLVLLAIDRAITAEPQNAVAFIKGILKKWHENNCKTIDDACTYEQSFYEQKKLQRSQKKASSTKKKTVRKEMTPDWLKEQQEKEAKAFESQEHSKESNDRITYLKEILKIHFDPSDEMQASKKDLQEALSYGLVTQEELNQHDV
jgi:DnaD/phage-associated family protein